MDEDGLGEHTTLKEACGVLDWKAYVTEMCLQDETWGDAATLLAVACIFEAEVVVISSVTDDCVSTILPPPHWKVPSRQRIILGHYHEYHYTSTQPTVDCQGAGPRNDPNGARGDAGRRRGSAETRRRRQSKKENFCSILRTPDTILPNWSCCGS